MGEMCLDRLNGAKHERQGPRKNTDKLMRMRCGNRNSWTIIRNLTSSVPWKLNKVLHECRKFLWRCAGRIVDVKLVLKVWDEDRRETSAVYMLM